MKKTLLLFLSFLFCLSLSAQLTLDKAEYVETFTLPQSTPVEVSIKLTNNSDEAIDWYWRINTIDAPSEWTPFFCDLFQCHPPGKLESKVGADNVNSSPANETKTISFHVMHGSVAAVGTYEVELYDPTSGDVLTTIYLTIAETTVATHQQPKEIEVVLYPNPTTDYISLKGEVSQVSQLNIYNILGSKVKSIGVDASNRYDVSNLTHGRYLVRALDKDGQTLKVLRVIKY